jgi:hypothetical protein
MSPLKKQVNQIKIGMLKIYLLLKKKIKQFGQDGKFVTRLGGLETLEGVGDQEGDEDSEGLLGLVGSGELEGLWGFESS